VHNLSKKTFGIILRPWATLVPIFAFLLFVVSAAVREENSLFIFQPIFRCFWKILLQLKSFFKNLSACIILILDATLVPNLMFLGLLSPEISLGEKLVTHTATQPISQSVNLSAAN